jgi:hypothetical protein
MSYSVSENVIYETLPCGEEVAKDIQPVRPVEPPIGLSISVENEKLLSNLLLKYKSQFGEKLLLLRFGLLPLLPVFKLTLWLLSLISLYVGIILVNKQRLNYRLKICFSRRLSGLVLLHMVLQYE